MKVLSTDDFKQLVYSNEHVNKTVTEFVERLDRVKEEVERYEATYDL